MGRKIEKTPRVLVTGARGMVGSYITIGTRLSHEDLDITDGKAVQSIVNNLRPEVIVHLAALTDVDYCERNPKLAYEVNAVGTYNIACAAREVGAKVVYVSTAGVFDGKKRGAYRPEDKPNPQNIYGLSKLAGEEAVKSKAPRFLIVRTCWMFGGGPKKDRKFVSKIIARLKSGKTVHAVTDLYGSPTFGKDLAFALENLIRKDTVGILNVVNRGRANRLEEARVVAKTLFPKAKLLPCKNQDFNSPTIRASNEVLVPSIPLRPWKRALTEYLRTEWF